MQWYIALSIVLCVLYVVLIISYLFGFLKEPVLPSNNTFNQPFFSIIIPARNEENNIADCLQSILRNNYSQYEIILIDDHSTDKTYEIANSILAAPHKIIRLQKLLAPDEKINAFKKKALALAIAASKGEYIITTDADCFVTPTWLKNFAQGLSQKDCQMIAGPVSFMPYDKKNLLYYFQSLDFMTMQGITIATNRLKLGIMGNGANLLFSRIAYDTVKGYASVDHLASGDDMMLMHKIDKQFPDALSYLKEKSSIVETPVQPTWRAFLNQRIRWASKADAYPQKKLTWVLVLVYFFNLNFLIMSIASLYWHDLWKMLLTLFIVKVLIELVFLVPVARFYNKMNELAYFVILQPLHIIYIISAGFLGKFGTYNWKGRTVR